MAKPEKKTNAMRMLDAAGIAYEALHYELDDDEFSGGAVSALLGIPAEQCFKTLRRPRLRRAKSRWRWRTRRSCLR